MLSCCSPSTIDISFIIHLNFYPQSETEDLYPYYSIHSFLSILFLKDCYNHYLNVYIEANQGNLNEKLDFLYIVPEKAPVPKKIDKTNAAYRFSIKIDERNGETGYSECAISNLSLNEPYIMHYLRKNKQDIQLLKTSSVFKLVYRRTLPPKKNDMDIELRVIYEDDPDFYRISFDLPIFSTPSKVLSTRIESTNSNEPPSSTNQPQNDQIITDYSNQKKNHYRNYSNFTAKSTSIASDSHSNITLLKRAHHKNSLSLATPTKGGNGIVQSKPDYTTKKKNAESLSLYSLRAMNHIKTPSQVSVNSNYEAKNSVADFLSNLKKQKSVGNKMEIMMNNKKTEKKDRRYQNFIKFNKDFKPIDRFNLESPEQSFFLNVNELNASGINKTKPSPLTKFITPNKKSPPNQKLETLGNYQTPQSKKRLYTVEEVHSFSNESSLYSSMMNETHFVKFTNTNTNSSEKKISYLRNAHLKKKGVIDVVEEDDELSLNHLTANELAELDSKHIKLFFEELEENIDSLPKFLIYDPENKNNFIRFCKKMMKKFTDIGYYFLVDFAQNILCVYAIEDDSIYQTYKFKVFQSKEDFFNLFEDIFASVKFETL